MSISVTGVTRSSRTQRVLFVLEELKLSYDLIPVDLANGEHRSPLFLAENHPFGNIPAFEEDGTKLFESRAICRYLVAKYNGPLSLPTNAVDLGRFEQADSVGYSYFDPAVEGLAYEKIFRQSRGHGETVESTVQELERQLSQCLDYYENLLSKQEGLASNGFSLVDLFHAPMVEFVSSRLGLDHHINSRPHVKAWWDRISDRPSWKACDCED